MKENKIILKPVKVEDYQLQFGGNTALASATPEEAFNVTISQFKKLAVGSYFWFVADAVKGITHSAGGMIEKLVPITIQELVNNSPEILFRNTHPDDISQMFAFTNYWIAFISNLPAERLSDLRPTIYIRLQNAEKLYKWVMVQYADTIKDTEGKVLYGLTLITDISHIKKEGVAMMSILDAFDDSCQVFYCAEGKAVAGANQPIQKISHRELEVLRLLAVGYSSKQVAAELAIALNTVHNHRQSMLRKTGTKSSGELVAYGINMGYI